MTGAVTSTGDPPITMGKGNFGITSTNTGTAAFVAGESNLSQGNHSAAGGGEDNLATGPWSTVPGGFGNAAGAYSVAMGRNARAINGGSFVFSDSLGTDFTTAAPNTFAARANSGFYFAKTGSTIVTLPAVTILTDTGAFLTNAGVWTNASDVDRKEDFAEVDRKDVLARLMALPITSWKYKVEPAGVRHIGPTSQDFMSQFGLGMLDIGIGTLDADGVALVAIQALGDQIAELEERLSALEALLGR